MAGLLPKPTAEMWLERQGVCSTKLPGIRENKVIVHPNYSFKNNYVMVKLRTPFGFRYKLRDYR